MENILLQVITSKSRSDFAEAKDFQTLYNSTEMGRFKDEVYGDNSFHLHNINQEFRKDWLAGEADEPEIKNLFLFWDCWQLWQDHLRQVKSLEICT